MTVTSWQWPERGYKDNILHRWNIKSLFVEKSRLAGTPKSKAPCWLLVMPYATRTPGMNTVDSLLTDTSLRRPPRNNGHFEVAPTFLYSFNAIGVYEINHIRTAGKKSNEEWSSQLWMQSTQLRKKAEKKFQDFNGVWTCALAIPVRCFNQMSYEATYVGSWSIMCSYVPAKEMKVIDVPRKWNQMKNDPRSYVRNLCNCIRGCIAPVSRGHGFKPHWSPEFCCLFSFQILRGSFFIWFTHFSWLSIKRTLGSGPKGVRLRESA